MKGFELTLKLGSAIAQCALGMVDVMEAPGCIAGAMWGVIACMWASTLGMTPALRAFRTLGLPERGA